MAKIPGMNIEYSFGENDEPVDWRSRHEPDTEDYDEPDTEESRRKAIEQYGFDIFADAEDDDPDDSDDDENDADESSENDDE